MAASSSIQNLNKPKDAFEQLEDEEGTRQGFCHIRIQQRTGRKTITTVQGIAPEYDLKKIVRYLKKEFCSEGRISMRNIMLSKFTLLYGLIALRIVNVFLVRTYFVPDELFQSVEVAHWAVYGTGYLSWEWMASLRSVLHPFIIAVLYFLGHMCAIDSNLFIIQTPRLLHGLLFALSDYCYYKFAKRILSPSGAKYALLSYLSCWFIWYCAPRTLSNTLETVLTLFALQWYPLSKADLKWSYWPYMSIGFLTILIRPTAILIWIPFGLWHLWRSDSLVELFCTCLSACFPVLFIVIILDSVAYGKLTFTTWNFIRFNVLEGGSSHFGSHPWYWFISQGLPAVLTIHLIPIFWGIIIAVRNRCIPFAFFSAPALYVTIHSLIAHKEHRFLLPIIPFLCIFAGIFFHNNLSHTMKKCHTLWIRLLLVVNVFLAAYFGLFHQIGPLSATNWIIEDAKLRFSKGQRFELVHLMPCFSLPQYSYFHGLNVTVTALDCSPVFPQHPDHVDQADHFHDDPPLWINANLDLVKKAHYIVFYEKIYRKVQYSIISLGFKICAHFFHAHFLSSTRQDHYIVIVCR
uniref:Mannosyltransferase n=1 Tax=Elaeophora elaphi TaxID=1147741 RepID=A0A0R3RKB5_9BILA